ncbi:AAA family ATPase [Psychromonas sp. KJ10-10]|uniref:AAA family ATPase n=1 Tax=Psychromonas sp. KJ10-10 TaxID=3391823 RepID=UPI0039B42312
MICSQVAKHKTRFLITLNGGNSGELVTAAEDIADFSESDLKNTSAIEDKSSPENVSSLFTEARQSRDILLFEKSDLLFDKKTALKTSHERDIGFDLNNLFKNIAKHNGIVILSTQKKQTLNASMSTKVDVLIRFK